MRGFKLSQGFLDQYKDTQPNWGPLGFVVYKRTYSRIKEDGTAEEFWETIKRVVEGCYAIQKDHCKNIKVEWDNEKAQASAQEMYRRMWEFKFLPPGRGLWIMGTDVVEKKGGGSLNNPLHGDTPILTRDGWVPIKSVSGKEVELLSSTKLYGRDHTSAASAPIWAKAKISNYEKQPCYKLTFIDKSRNVTEIISSINHRWYRKATTKAKWERVTTEELKVNDYFPIVKPIKNYPVSRFGAQHGLFFGDGTRSNGELHQFSDSVEVLRYLFGDLAQHVTTRRPDEWVVRNCPNNIWSKPPAVTSGDSYILGFLSGYFAADGTVSSDGQCVLASSRRSELDDVRNLFFKIGIRTSPIRLNSSSSNLKEDRELYSMTIHSKDLMEEFFLKKSHRLNWVKNHSNKNTNDNAKLVSIEYVGYHEVYCATVPDLEQFVVDGFILTSNCAYISTEELSVDFAEPFCWMMDMLMLGVGVGFDSVGAGTVLIKEPKEGTDVHVVPDTREGWVDLLRRVLLAYSGKGSLPIDVDYSEIRKEGEPIKTFGGTSSGYKPLKDLIDAVKDVLHPLIGKKITVTAINDIFNLVGRCVVAGNIRRSAQLSLGASSDQEFLDLKNPEINKERLIHHGWASNNSILAKVGMDYTEVAKSTSVNGEPGYVWLENAQAFSRMGREPDYKDYRAKGTNPCQPADATVLTPTGISRLENIEVGSIIWSGKQWTRVTDKWCTGIKPVFVYQTRAGEFIGTENHRVVSKGEKREVGTVDSIDTCQGDICPPTKHIPEHVMNGLVLGDGGNSAGVRGRPVLYIGTNDSCYFDSEIKDFINGKAGENSYYVEQSLTKRLVPVHKREIPEKYFTENSVVVRSFLRGLFSANGSVVSNRVTLKSTSIKLIKQVQQLLSSLGIRSYYTVNKKHDTEFRNGTYTCRESYDLNISTDRDIFYETIGFIHPYKNEKLLNIISKIGTSKFAFSRPKDTYEITSKEYRGDELVYDITVDAEEHTYWTGGLLVSNCGEQTLENMELCCLVETFPINHDSYDDYEKTLKYAYLYAKTVTLVPTHSPRTNSVLQRNRRIGCSMSGIVQAMNRFGRREFFNWCDQGYSYLEELDTSYSDWLCIPKSKKTTSIKPSGSVSLLPGVTPGIHFPHSEYYIRRIRFRENSPLVDVLSKHGYMVEEDVYSPNTVVVSFPIKEDYFSRGKYEVSMWEQLELAAQMQQYWADNQVSITVTFKEHEVKDIKYALELYETRLKSVSFLPIQDHGYAQAPYEAITEEKYIELSSKITPIYTAETTNITNEIQEKFCDGDVCTVQ